ncbi:unnamed protein product [Dibothriocephalus latus]|uniref:Serine-threonine/tyrosine-protein kinase catalytic domain-containing protein n=1 Tax=Dibothriocephalus latus TaxID=60516 RepID=A0A3P7S5H7_DIBLA|nr:unnamed protein product [Dibothriocephalus latus]
MSFLPGVLMWEVFTYCLENPYHGMNNAQVYQFIVGGGRLHKPAICPDRLYVLMLECWQHVSRLFLNSLSTR